MAYPPIALPSALPSELLTWILNHSAYPTTILICKSRAAFVSSLLADITSNTSLPPASSPQYPISATAPVETLSHSLLLKILHQISISRHISFLYVPTTSHLRAYLSVLSPETRSKIEAPPDLEWDKLSIKRAMIVVYGLVELHRDTSEWSAQGLNRSLAGLVDMGGRHKRAVVCLEERTKEKRRSDELNLYGEGEGDFDDTSNDGDGMGSDENRRRDKRTWNGWDEKVPMLNGSVRRAGSESEDSGWSGRTVEVGRIFARWFDFQKAEWDHGT
ncbi:ffc07818-f94c-40ab-8e7a-50cd104b8be1-CDS [Sclerotinia trifoliorum]|uniref:Ffc07818-f94c-40ab-8e7a-50cd104b8be1-CDS n=1 Tax=Sclerotinia trifoliorum TaxID=28548 RepID=A0A8H2ZS42_9HELO|nr:ffc07818-f94c-40ab-8e7a-50cd104b8be1-CDS [Sclerotinia trifoliorum]